MAPSPVLPKLVGQRVKRREDPRLIQGRATYVDDVKIPGMLHLAFKRSDVAHGRILSIDTSAAEAMAGVEAVFTGAQIAEMLPPMPIGTPLRRRITRGAVDIVRSGGEPACVVAQVGTSLATSRGNRRFEEMLPASSISSCNDRKAGISAGFEQYRRSAGAPRTGVSAREPGG